MFLSHRVHLYPFRTQKLSCAEPKILVGRPTGKIGQCQHTLARQQPMQVKTMARSGNRQDQSRSLKGKEKRVGVFIAQGPPVPIPNTEVKLCGAENTCRATYREDRSMPTLFSFLYLFKPKKHLPRVDKIIYLYIPR